MDRASVTIKTYQNQEEDATIHIDVEEDLLELAEDVHAFYMWLTEGEINSKWQQKEPGDVTQRQV